MKKLIIASIGSSNPLPCDDHLLGFAVWHLGMEDPGMWRVLGFT